MRLLRIFFLMATFFCGCNNSKPKITRSLEPMEGTDSLVAIKKEGHFKRSQTVDEPIIPMEGVLNLSSILHPYNKDALEVLNPDMSIYLQIHNGKIIELDKVYDLFEIGEREMGNLINSISFFPDYSVWYVLASNNDKGYVELESPYGIKMIRGDYFKLLSYDEFLKGQLIGLSDKSPLRREPDEGSDIIEDFEKYEYQFLDINGNWIKLKLTEFTPPDEPSYEEMGLDISGWVRWKQGNQVLVDFYYDY